MYKTLISLNPSLLTKNKIVVLMWIEWCRIHRKTLYVLGFFFNVIYVFIYIAVKRLDKELEEGTKNLQVR
jgi:hypothetical protein